MWPAFNSFVVLLPCGKKGADPPLERDARLQGWARRDEEREAEGGTSLFVSLSLCVRRKNFFFLRAIFDPRNYFLKSDLFFLGRNYFSNRDLVYLFVFLIEGIFPCEIFDMYNYFLTYLGHGCVLSSSFL